MRKYFIAMLIIIIMMTTGVAWESADVSNKAGNVNIEIKDYYGDLHAADGLTVSFQEMYMRKSLWDIKAMFNNGKMESIVDYQLLRRDLEDKLESNLGIYNMGFMSYVDESFFVDENSERKSYGLLKQIYDRSKDEDFSDEFTVTTMMSDLCDYYPIQVRVDVPGKLYGFGNGCFEMIDVLDTGISYMKKAPHEVYNALKLNSFLHIPVDENQMVRINCQGNESKEGVLLNIESITDMGFNLSTLNTIWTGNDNAFYFAFSNRNSLGDVVDTSLIPGGYGIYRLPYGYICQEDYHGEDYFEGYDIIVDDLKTICQVNENALILDLEVDAMGKELYYVTEEDGKFFLYFAEAESGTLRDSVFLGEAQEEDWIDMKLQENFLYIKLGYRKLFVASSDDSENINLVFDTDIENQTFTEVYDTKSILQNYETFAFNGESVAIIGRNLKRNDKTEYNGCGFTMLVLNKDGIEYFGECVTGFDEYNDSLDEKATEWISFWGDMTAVWDDTH